MKATVQISFKDKETGKQYKPGKTFEASAERIKEINKALKGALEVLIEPTPEQLDLVVETETVIKKRRRSKKA
jgi:hypothetical protein